jgi:hypothetical protein
MLIKVPVNVGNLSQINWKTQIPRKQNPMKFQFPKFSNSKLAFTKLSTYPQAKAKKRIGKQVICNLFPQKTRILLLRY